jgi:hypothetical protein
MTRATRFGAVCRCGVVLAVVLGTLALPAPGQAAYDPLGSGATRLSFDRSFLSLMKENGVALSAVAPAKMKDGAVTFPVSGGKFDPLSAKGTVEHEGALVFRAGRRQVPLKALQLKTTSRRTPLSVKAGGGQLKLGTVKGMAVSRTGFGNKVKVSALALSTKVATRLGKKLRLRNVFEEGLPLGKAVTHANPTTVTVIPKERITLTLAPGLVDKLNSLFVAVNPIFPAEHVGPVFTLPISGGTIAPDASQGVIETEGAIEALQLGGGQVFWRGPWLDLASRALEVEAGSESRPGEFDRVPVAGFTFTAPAVVDSGARTVGLSAALTLDAATAASFNEAFAKPQGKKDVFSAGEPLGSLSLTVASQ